MMIISTMKSPSEVATEASEHQEQKAVVDWCHAKKIAVASVPNGFFIPAKTMQAKRRVHGQIRKLKAEGYAPGFPDLMVFIPSMVLFIEMKKKTGGRVSPEQKEWHKKLRSLGYFVLICHGADQAISEIKNAMV